MYWSHTDLDYNVPAKIYSANIDGSGEEVLVDTNLLYVSKYCEQLHSICNPQYTSNYMVDDALLPQVTLLWTGLEGICTGWTVPGPE